VSRRVVFGVAGALCVASCIFCLIVLGLNVYSGVIAAKNILSSNLMLVAFGFGVAAGLCFVVMSASHVSKPKSTAESIPSNLSSEKKPVAVSSGALISKSFPPGCKVTTLTGDEHIFNDEIVFRYPKGLEFEVPEEAKGKEKEESIFQDV
jgi:hypothetical protein